MQEMPPLESCDELLVGESGEKSTFSFSKAPIATLPFTGPEGLKWEDFERLCCRLMGKIFRLNGYRRYTRGRNQEGIDIYGYRSTSMDSLVVIQCKRYTDINLTKFRRAVDEFKRGWFFDKASEFLILVACDLLPETVEKASIEVRRELSGRCVFDIWTGERISQELKPYPEIAEAFYRQDVVEALCQPWGLRQRLLEELYKLHSTDKAIPVPSVAIPADDKQDINEFLQSKDISLSDYDPFSQHFRYKSAFVYVSSYLPTERDYTGSCLFDIKQSNLDGCLFNFGHDSIVDIFVRGAGSPPKSRYRRFFVYESERNSAVQLPAVRLFLYDQLYLGFCEAVDALAKAYTEALKRLEVRWGAGQYPFAYRGSVVVELGHIPVWLWRALLDFAQRHDATAGNSEWHTFEPSGWLKHYTKAQSRLLNSGYHALISADEAANSPRLTDRTRLYWHPPPSEHMKLGERDYWPCQFAFRWLHDKLIPTVFREVWLKEHRTRLPWRRKRDESDFNRGFQHSQIVDARSPKLSASLPSQGTDGLWKVVSELQKYAMFDLDEPISGDMMSSVYKMLAFLASRTNITYWGYVSSKLELEGSAKAEIVAEIAAQGAAVRAQSDTGWMLDDAMRAAMEMIDHGSIHLTSEEIAACLDNLNPVAQIYDTSNFIKRHRLRSG